MYIYQVTIGRNVGSVPMTLTRWEFFKEDVAEEFRSVIEKTRATDGYAWTGDEEFRIEVHYGKGIWEGVEEESAHITVLATARLTHIAQLREGLRYLAEEYVQDSIALTIGESELVESY